MRTDLAVTGVKEVYTCADLLQSSLASGLRPQWVKGYFKT